MRLTKSSQLVIKNYLQISAFLDPVVMKQEEISYALQKATGEATSKVVRRQLAKHGQA